MSESRIDRIKRMESILDEANLAIDGYYEAVSRGGDLLDRNDEVLENLNE